MTPISKPMSKSNAWITWQPIERCNWWLKRCKPTKSNQHKSYLVAIILLRPENEFKSCTICVSFHIGRCPQNLRHYLKCCCTEWRSSFVFVHLFEDIGHWMHRRNNERLLVASANEYGRRTGFTCNNISVYKSLPWLLITSTK